MCRKTPLNACIAVWTLTQLKSQIIKNVLDSWRCEMKFRDINSCSCCPLATHGTQILRYGGRDQTEQIHESFHDHFYWCILNEEQREVLFSLRMWKDFLLDEHTKKQSQFPHMQVWNMEYCTDNLAHVLSAFGFTEKKGAETCWNLNPNDSKEAA